MLLADIDIRTFLHFPFLFSAPELAHRRGPPPTCAQGCVPRYTCLPHAGSVCVGSHPTHHRPRMQQCPGNGSDLPPEPCLRPSYQGPAAAGGPPEAAPEWRIPVQGFIWGVVWEMPLRDGHGRQGHYRPTVGTLGDGTPFHWQLRASVQDTSHPRGRDAGVRAMRLPVRRG